MSDWDRQTVTYLAVAAAARSVPDPQALAFDGDDDGLWLDPGAHVRI